MWRKRLVEIERDIDVLLERNEVGRLLLSVEPRGSPDIAAVGDTAPQRPSISRVSSGKATSRPAPRTRSAAMRTTSSFVGEPSSR